LKTEYRTLAETLKDAGYATAHFGKWHLGPEPYSPLQQGFDFDLPHHPGPGPAGSFVAPWKFANFKEKSPGEHIEDRMAAEAGGVDGAAESEAVLPELLDVQRACALRREEGEHREASRPRVIRRTRSAAPPTPR
jgi:arylsulfatase A-like enzyme